MESVPKTMGRAWLRAVLTYLVVSAAVFYLAFGIGPPRGPLSWFLERTFSILSQILGADIARYTLVLLLALIPAVASLAVFSRHVPTGPDDGMLHCLKCGYTLKGLSEPRCPECGERI